MKKFFIIIMLSILFAVEFRSQDAYYYGDLGEFNASIPTPESFFGFRLGTSLVRYDRVVEYFRLLASSSDRARIEVFGNSWEGREQVALIITSPSNQRSLEDIRVSHLRVVDPSSSVDLSSEKVIVYLGYNVHGGEIAGTDASVLAAYYYVASESPEVIRRLGEAVLLIEPSQNPDGRERATTYINGFHSLPPVSDPADLEHGPGQTQHRGNHFWNDLNRDWLALSQVESRNRVAYYHRWYPNIFLDYHEMGSGSTYYFEPSPRATWSVPAVPESNYTVLNNILAKYFSSALNRVGGLYYTKESFTNLSPIYGSTYPDYQGGVGVTLEIGGTRGIELETEAGIRTFSENLRDNLLTSVAVLPGATDERAVFLTYQRDFFRSALSEAVVRPEKYIIFGSVTDRSLNALFLDHLLRHGIEVYELPSAVTEGGKSFEVGSAWLIPYRQSQYRIVHSIFEENTSFSDPIFYDNSSWSTVHGYGIPFIKTKSVLKSGARVTAVPEVVGKVLGESSYAYAFDYFDYLSARALYFLQSHGVQVRVAQKPFTSRTSTGERSFAPGSIVIPLRYQKLAPSEVYRLLEEAASQSGITVSAITDGFSLSGIDLGSNNIRIIKQPVVGIVTGGGSSWINVGEIWQLLGNTFNIPLSKLDVLSFDRLDLSRYTSLIFVSDPRLSAVGLQRLTSWVESGGTLIAIGGAAEWAITSKLTTGLSIDSAARIPEIPFNPRGWSERSANGAVLLGELNLDHALTYGFTSREIFTPKSRLTGLPKPASAESVVLKTLSGVPVDGYVTPENRDKLKDLPLIVSSIRGRGTVVLFSESPALRGYFLSTGRILVNAILFGSVSRYPNDRFQ